MSTMHKFIRRYGVAGKVRFPVKKAGSNDFAVSGDWTPVAGDCRIGKDFGSPGALTNLPTPITFGNGALWEWSYTAAEATAGEINVTIIDATSKTVEDVSINIQTYGHPNSGLAWIGAVDIETPASATNQQVVLSGTPPIDPTAFAAVIHSTTGGGGSPIMEARVADQYTPGTLTITFVPNLNNTPSGTITIPFYPFGARLAQDIMTSQQGSDLASAVATVGNGVATVSSQLPTTLSNGLIAADVQAVGGTTQTAGDLVALETANGTKIDGVKAKTDQLGFTSGKVNSEVKSINNATVTGAGTPSNPWGGA